jgi:hypothetical protein
MSGERAGVLAEGSWCSPLRSFLEGGQVDDCDHAAMVLTRAEHERLVAMAAGDHTTCPVCRDDYDEAVKEDVAAAVAAAVEAEREACAGLADNFVITGFAETMSENDTTRTARRIAAAIRARRTP